MPRAAALHGLLLAAAIASRRLAAAAAAERGFAAEGAIRFEKGLRLNRFSAQKIMSFKNEGEVLTSVCFRIETLFCAYSHSGRAPRINRIEINRKIRNHEQTSNMYRQSVLKIDEHR